MWMRDQQVPASGDLASTLIVMLRFLTAGESHGRALVVVVEGLPAGLPIAVDAVQAELARRRLGIGGGPRMRFEQDDVTIVGGVGGGRSLGSPLANDSGYPRRGRILAK